MDLIGINVNKIPEMKEAVETYVGKVKTELAKLENVEATTGFKGESIVPGFTSYVNVIIKAGNDLSSRLNVFLTKLDEIKAAYIKKDAANASILTERSQTAQSWYKEYTYTSGEGTEAAR